MTQRILCEFYFGEVSADSTKGLFLRDNVHYKYRLELVVEHGESFVSLYEATSGKRVEFEASLLDTIGTGIFALSEVHKAHENAANSIISKMREMEELMKFYNEEDKSAS